MDLGSTIDKLLETVKDSHAQANPSHLIQLFDDALGPAMQLEPIKDFYRVYLKEDTPSTSLNRNGMLMYLPELKQDLADEGYIN